MHQQISLFPLQNFEPDFTSDDWETPDDIARAMAALIKTSDGRFAFAEHGRRAYRLRHRS